MNEPKTRNEFRWTDEIDFFLGACAFVTYWALTLVGLLIVFGQAGLWLYGGEWISLSAADLISIIAALFEGDRLATWAAYPSSWIGLHKILSSFHASLLLFGLAIVFAGIAASLDFDGFHRR